MKKTLLTSVALASLAGFGLANAATVYENEGFSLSLNGKVEGKMDTTFGYYESYNLKAVKDLDAAGKKAYWETARKDKNQYTTANFKGIIKGELNTILAYQATEGLAVGAGFKLEFDNVKYGADIKFGGAQIMLGGTSILGKITFGSQHDAVYTYVSDSIAETGAQLDDTAYKKLASLSYELGPVMGLNLLIGASLPMALVDNRPDTLNPSSTSGYTLGLKYALELDKDMFVKFGFGYTSFTGNTKTKSPMDTKQYAPWAHELGLGLAFETELVTLGLSYQLDFIPAVNNGKKGDLYVSVRTPMTHRIAFKAEMGILEGLKVYTELLGTLNEAGTPVLGGNVLVKANATTTENVGKSALSVKNGLNFKIGAKYTIVEGLTFAGEIVTESTFTTLAVDKDGKTNADTAMSTVTVPGLNFKLKYEF